MRESQAEALKLPATGMIPTEEIGFREAASCIRRTNSSAFGDLANLFSTRRLSEGHLGGSADLR